MQASALAVALAPLDMEAPAPIPDAVTAAALQVEASAAPSASWTGAILPPTESTPLVAPNMPPNKSPLRVGLRHVVERERQRRQDLVWRIWLAAFVAWLFITTSFYKYFALSDFCPLPPGALTNFRNPVACKEPTWAAGLFYSVTMGFHVGFGLFTERNEWWKLFTILHGLVMILFITSALAIFMALLSNKASEVLLPHCRERVLMHAITPSQIALLPLRQPSHVCRWLRSSPRRRWTPTSQGSSRHSGSCTTSWRHFSWYSFFSCWERSSRFCTIDGTGWTRYSLHFFRSRRVVKLRRAQWTMPSCSLYPFTC